MIKRILSLQDHHFYSPLINNASIVVDLGANQGLFSKKISDTFGCRTYAIEANPYLYALLPGSDLIKKFNYAVSDKNEAVVFNISVNPEAGTTQPVSSETYKDTKIVPGITLTQFLKEQNIPAVDLLKVDIEGAEILLFGSLPDVTLKTIKQITIEFHDFVYGDEFRLKVNDIISRLKRLGFLHINCSDPPQNDDTLFINKAYLSVYARLDLLIFKMIRLKIRHVLKKYKKSAINVS